jgi:Ribosomal protein L1p/L10e family
MATIVQKKVGKRYDAAASKIAPDKQYSFEEAVALLKSMPAAKFDQSVDLSFRLGVDPKHADQMVRGAVVMPHGIGKTVRIAVFAKGEKEREAREAGADVIGAEDLVERVQGGWMEFDTAIATPDLMGQVGRLGKELGGQGRVPRRQGRQRAHAHRQALVQRRAAPGQRDGADRGDRAREAGGGQGHVSPVADRLHDDGARRPRRRAGRGQSVQEGRLGRERQCQRKRRSRRSRI